MDCIQYGLYGLCALLRLLCMAVLFSLLLMVLLSCARAQFAFFTACFHSSLCLSYHSQVFLRQYFLENPSFNIPSFCCFRPALRHVKIHHSMFCRLGALVYRSSCSCSPPSSFVTSVCSLASSANVSTPRFIHSFRLTMNIMNRVGPRTDPCRTLLGTSAQPETLPSITLCFLNSLEPQLYSSLHVT